MTMGEWTAARLALLDAEYPSCTDHSPLERINALPGRPISSWHCVRSMASRRRLKKTPEALETIQAQAGAKGVAGRTKRRSARTPERETLMRAEYPHAIDWRDLMAKTNDLPGEPVRTYSQIKQWARALGLSKAPAAMAEIKRIAGSENLKKAHAVKRVYAKKERQPAAPRPPRERKARPPKSTVPQMRKARIPQPKQTARQPEPGQFVAPTDRPSWGHRISVAVPAACEDLSPAEQAEIADAALEHRLASARAMIARKMAGKSPQAGMRAFDASCAAIVSATRLPHKTVRRIAGEVRMGVGA